MNLRLRPAGLLVLCALSLLAIGCETATDFIESKYYHGTLMGYQKCLERNKIQGLPIEMLQNFCREENAVGIHIKHDGEAGYEEEPSPFPPKISQSMPAGTVKYKFSGWLKNESKDHVVTSFRVCITHKDYVDQNGSPVNQWYSLDPAWIRPGEQRHFSLTNLKFQPDNPNKDRFSWDVDNILGLKIEMK